MRIRNNTKFGPGYVWRGAVGASYRRPPLKTYIVKYPRWCAIPDNLIRKKGDFLFFIQVCAIKRDMLQNWHDWS